MDTRSVATAWLGTVGYALQIYFDFSGYSDMAIGLGRIFGFEFMENFNYPYISRSIKEFWRRWHISLSGWFRDYLYIPLGGSRKGNVYLHLFLVFLATGIWHGAAWGFVAWGLYHGFFRLLEYYIENRHKRKSDLQTVAPNSINLSIRNGIVQFAGWLYTMIVVIVGWVIFAKVDLGAGVSYLAVMFGLKRNAFVAYDIAFYLSRQKTFFMIVAMLACVPWRQLFYRAKETSFVVQSIRRLLLLGLLVLSFVFIINSSYNPFIYFRF
jgi:alginate O-acetyltransferase complex protein AlgI